jgi:hypothetical protein
MRLLTKTKIFSRLFDDITSDSDDRARDSPGYVINFYPVDTAGSQTKFYALSGLIRCSECYPQKDLWVFV